MHDDLKDIPYRILENAIGALRQANQHAVFYDPGMEHWQQMAALNTALAGELFIKAIIAKEHPLLIFRDLFHLDNNQTQELDLERIIEKGRTYNFEHLPKLLWVATGERIPDLENFEKLRKTRNSIQHFCSPEEINLRRLSLEFIYRNIDPLIHKHFGLYAIDYHEDDLIGYDYIVECLVKHEILFSIPSNFCIKEVDITETLSNSSSTYISEFKHRLNQSGCDSIL